MMAREEDPPKPEPAVSIEKRTDYGKVCLTSFILCLISGMVNIVAFCEMGFVISHHSGNLSHMGRLGLAGGRWALLGLCYMVGAGVTGFHQSNGDSPIQGRKTPALLAAGFATAAGVWLYVTTKGAASMAALALWSYGQGLQNGVTSKFSSLPLRTTHHTGSITDAGAAIGNWLRAVLRGEQAPPLARTGLLLVCIAGYATGAYLAKRGTDLYGIYMGLMPAIAMAIVGLGRGGGRLFKKARPRVVEVERELVTQ